MRVDRPLTLGVGLALLLTAAGPACGGHGGGTSPGAEPSSSSSTSGGGGTSTSAAGVPPTSGRATSTTGGAPSTSTRPAPASVADALVQAANRAAELRARGVSDLSAASDAFVHVRADGALEVVLHTLAPATADQLAALRALGGEVESSSATPPGADGRVTGLVQAWVPSDRLLSLAGLGWVAAVTPPTYGTGGG